MGDTMTANNKSVSTSALDDSILSNTKEAINQDGNDIKEQIRRDVFTSEEEAQERAEEIGCSGTHTHDENGNTVFMPCKTHAEYTELTGRTVSGYGKKPKKKKPKDMKDALDVLEQTLEKYMPAEDEDEKTIAVPVELKMDPNDTNEQYGVFEGYGSMFGNTDLGNDVIEKGAFRESLMSRPPEKVKLLYQHKSDMPIGVFDEIREDENGLYVKGRLALKTKAGAEAYELLKMGALDGLSIGFKTDPKNVSYEERGKVRRIKKVDLMEVSLVTFPMNPKATVRLVKGEDISIREWEKGLRDAFQLSRSEAKICAKALEDCFDQREADPTSELVDAIKNLTLTIKTS